MTIRRTTALALLFMFVMSVLRLNQARAKGPVSIRSPGFPPSHMGSRGQLIEDWGTVDIRLNGQVVPEEAIEVKPVTVNKVIPAARAVSNHGAVQMTRTVYRAPVFPAGVDVLQVDLNASDEKDVNVTLTLSVSVGTHVGARTARIGGRTVLVLPREIVSNQPLLDWGFRDEATSLPNWAKPQGNCDPAFRNIRAGMGGVPISYRFSVPPGSDSSVALGFCESHWADKGNRPMQCIVEGTASKIIDPVAEWGQHKPGVLLFRARDANGDGNLEITVHPAPHASDRNPILNVIWIHEGSPSPPLDKVIAGDWNDACRYYVDVGGRKDQSIFPPGKMEFAVQIPAGDTRQLTFLVASPGGSASDPTSSSWNNATLLRAAENVWTDWQP